MVHHELRSCEFIWFAVNDAEAALRVVKHLHRLQGQWQHILQDSVYERLMGYLLEYVLRLVMKPVFEVGVGSQDYHISYACT